MPKTKKALFCIATAGIAILSYKKLQKYSRKIGNPPLGFSLHDIFNHNADPLDFSKSVYREFKYALQRAKHGYDDTMFWNFDSHLDALIMTDLRWMIKHRHGSPVLEDWTEETCHDNFTEILKQMLYHFEQSTDEHCTEKNEFEDLVDYESYFIPTHDDMYRMEYKDRSEEAEDIREKYRNRSNEIEAYKKEHHEKALKLLTKYYRYLWD